MFDPRVLFVVGKGGVGKTTVAVLLADHLAAAGRRVLFVALGGPATTAPSRAPAISIAGTAPLDEYLGRKLGTGWLHRRIVNSRLYRRFAGAAPGLEELMALGKICDEERDGEWDAIVVDAPATGHALEYLEMPDTALRTFGASLVGFETTRMLRGLQDPRRFRVYPVTLAEEMPLSETEQLMSRARGLGLAIGGVFVNRVRRTEVTIEELDVAGPLRTTAALALSLARLETSWALAHRERIERVRSEWNVPVVELPLVADPNVLEERWSIAA